MTAANVAQSQPSLATYGGLFFVTLSTLMYEILLTRIFSVTMWFHFAFVAVSVALFGLTVGALTVYLLPRVFPQERTNERLYQASLLFSVAIVLSFITQLSIPFDPRWSLVSIYSVALTYLVIAVPFIFSGVAVTLALTRFPGQVGRLYAADLVGAGLGTITLIWLLNMLEDGPSAVLAVAGLAAVGAAVFAIGSLRIRSMALTGALAVVLVGLAAGNAALAQDQNAFLSVRWAKGGVEEDSLYEQWNEFSRIKVYADPVPEVPFGWGVSLALPDTLPVPRELALLIDGTAVTAITEYDGDPADLEYLRYDVVNLVHHLRDDADVFVIGSGGGRDVLTALVFEQPSITAVELNGDILDVVSGHYGDFTGHLDQQPGVTFINDEARSYLARSDDQFEIIQFSLIDTWAATAAGAYALSENSLYTVEAWDSFLDHLTLDGVLSVSRWYHRQQPFEAQRAAVLAAEALRRDGVEEPRQHLFMVRSESLAFDPVATLLVSKAPFSASDIAQVQRVVDEMEFRVVLGPEPVPSDPVFARIVQAEDPASVKLDFPADLSAPTDDRPFFFQMVRFQHVFDPDLYNSNVRYLTQPVLVLFSLAVAVIGLTLLFIGLPLLLTTSGKALRGMTPFIIFFSAIGLGFLLIEISQMQRLIIFLGHPTYALSVVLFSLLVFSGLGSLATDRLGNPGVRPILLAPLVLLVVVVGAFGFLTPAIIDGMEAQTTGLRISASVAILAPMGLVMGMPFPLGMKVASRKPGAPTAFFWGINGATSVCASVLAVAIAMGWGISMAFWAGCVSYVIAAAALGLVVLRDRA